jgi:predicted helicase
MIGLYLLSTSLLNILKIIKFGMSLRLEFRWIDYLSIFADSKYEYYYEFIGEYTRIYILEIENEIIQIFKDKRTEYFQTEYFNCNDKNEFHETIIKILNKNKINYKTHSEHTFKREYYDNNPEPFIIINNQTIQPYEEQQIIINKAYDYLLKNDKGLLILMCGVGKTLISLWISLKLNVSTILIGVPNILLLFQWLNEIKKIFGTINFLLVKNGIKTNDIIDFIKNNNKFVIITTYSSCYKVLKATNKINFIFDMKINDECHHLTSCEIKTEETKTFIEILNIKSIKQISLTATMKNIENIETISNDNIKYFGEIIDIKCLLWAIQKEIICDYIIQTIITDNQELKSMFKKMKIEGENDKRLFLSAYSTLQSICNNQSHHLLIYCNNLVNSIKIVEYIKLLLEYEYFIIPEIYFSEYNSTINDEIQENILENFNKSKFGIISCVYCLGEGYDNHIIDGVVFAENMSSNIRIIQSALRASRKNKNEPNKITKIIIPILNNNNDWLKNDNSDFLKIREIIYQMGLEDETIMSKIKVYKIDVSKKKQNINKNIMGDLGEYNDELTKSLRLLSTPRYALDITFEKARKIISDKNINFTSKNMYYELCEKDIRLPIDPEDRFRGNFNWIYYLSIPRIYYELDECIIKCKDYINKNPEIKKDHLDLDIINKNLCESDKKFPPYGLWVEYYKVKDLSEIIKIPNKQSKPKLDFS